MNYFCKEFLSIVVAILLVIKFIRTHFYRKFPSGPIKYPLIGSLLLWRKSPLEAMMHWKKIYGPIVGVRLGSWRAIIINDFDWIKEAFVQKAFNGRPDFIPALLFVDGLDHGTLTSEGDAWEIIRRFTIKNLNALGFGKRVMESGLKNDVSVLVESLRNVVTSADGPIFLGDTFYIAAINQLWNILFGHEILAERIFHIRQTISSLHKKIWTPIGSPIWMMPWLAQFYGQSDIKQAIKQFQQIVKDELAEVEAKGMNCERRPAHFVDAFLKEMRKAEQSPQSQFYKESGYSHLTGMMNNLLFTAAETLNNVMQWAILYLALNPDTQDKLWLEIEDVVGKSSMPSLNDQFRMPYTKSVINEILRISSSSPFSNFHCTTKAVEFKGYHIPKNTLVIANLYGLHHDAASWSQPEQFRPERFSDERDEISATPMIPFSVGLRTCFGQQYLKAEFFIMLTAIVQQFRFDWDASIPRPTEDELIRNGRVSIFRFCPEYKIILTNRQ